MNSEIQIKGKGRTVAVLMTKGQIVTDLQSALDLAITIRYEADVSRLALPKECLAEDFFILSTGLAGEILQRYVNYGFQLAVFGDFSHYTSKPLHDFIYECNPGKDFFFVPTEEEAVRRREELG